MSGTDIAILSWLPEVHRMLCDYFLPRLSEFDLQVYRTVVPDDHYLQKVLQVVPWDDFHDLLACYYTLNMGRPAESPVLMLKLEYLRYHHNLSDREVIARAETDLAFRDFLQIPLRWKLPDPSLLCLFRGRLGTKGFRQVFQQVIHTAREYGVVKDRLRIKDATHVIANMAVPTALALVAQTRDKLLAAAEPFAALMVEGERVSLEMLRETTKSQKDAKRLATRLAQLQEILVWADEVTVPDDAERNNRWQSFLAQRDLAHKILDQQEHPNAGDRTRSTTDPDARRAKHGEWYDGYLLDISMDADSELITQINVLPANGNESADALALVEQEQSAHGNDVEKLSIDGAGYDGPVIRELESAEGPDVKVFVPPKVTSSGGRFSAEQFELSEDASHMTCPAGQQSQYKQRDEARHTTAYRFNRETCHSCPLKGRCIDPQQKHGRTVRKNDYEPEYAMVRERAQTDEYAEVKREHPKVERRLGELINRHGGRRARYRGTGRVLVQQILGATTANMNRMIRLLDTESAFVFC